MAKRRKLSRKARAAAIKNLAKARRARKRKRNPTHVKSPRKAHRTARQKAAARRNIRKAVAGKRKKKACRRAAGRRGAAKRAGRRMPKMPKRCAPKRKKGRRRVKSVRTSHRKSAKRVAAGKKAARTRKRHLKKDHAAKHPRKRKSGKRKSGKRKGAKRAGKRKSAKRVAAGRKAARTRKAHKHGYLTQGDRDEASTIVYEKAKRRRNRRKSRRRNPIAALANPIRRRHRRRNPINPFMVNPIQGPGEFIAGLFGVGMGYVAANLVDRLLATHPLVSTSAGYVDSPPAGQIYDSEASLTPIWTSPTRFIAGIGMIFVPGVLSRFAPGNFKAFLQLAAYGAAAQVAGKAISDGIAAFAPSNSFVLQTYGGEVAAQAKLAAVGGGLFPSANAPGFAGVPRRNNRQLPAPTGVGGCAGNCGGTCGGGCAQNISTDPVADAQNAMSSGQPFVSTGLDSASLHWQSDPAVDPNAGSTDCAPMPVLTPTLNTLPGGGPPPTAPPPAAQLPAVITQQIQGGSYPQPQNCPPGQTWAPGIGCVTPGPDARLYPPSGPPGMSANAPPPPTNQVVPVKTVTPSANPVAAVPHIIS